jgi:NADPH-dependent 7-cyano-7-deazaguanine reductase QueF
MRVIAEFNTRGGISSVIEVEYEKENWKYWVSFLVKCFGILNVAEYK